MKNEKKKNEAVKSQKNKPIDEIKIGLIVASIWKNDSKNGIHFNVTISRLYKNGESWKRTDSFGRDDLLTLMKVLDQAHTRIYELAKESNE